MSPYFTILVSHVQVQRVHMLQTSSDTKRMATQQFHAYVLQYIYIYCICVCVCIFAICSSIQQILNFLLYFSTITIRTAVRSWQERQRERERSQLHIQIFPELLVESPKHMAFCEYVYFVFNKRNSKQLKSIHSSDSYNENSSANQPLDRVSLAACF